MKMWMLKASGEVTRFQKRIKIKQWCFLVLLGVSGVVRAQEHHLQKYYPPTDTLVQNKLAQWGDFKFGLLMHWGPYSQWGIVESWSICPEDEPWCERRGPYAPNYFEYKKAYEGLQNTFNPVKFNPEKWASAARDAGMKYMVFTTKHHDGFAMFDTKYSDYKITSPNTPFHTNPKANIAKEVFDAFRKEVKRWIAIAFPRAPNFNFSMRSGALNTYIRAGLSEASLMLAGGWKSSAIRAYIRLHAPSLAKELKSATASSSSSL